MKVTRCFPSVLRALVAPTTFLMLAALSAGALITPAQAAPPAGYTLKWSDEFDGTSLDTSKWGYEDLGAWRDATNTTDAVVVKDGVLNIKTFTENGQNYTAKISTRGKFEPTYGYMEVRAAFTANKGTWSAIWMLSPNFGKYVGDVARSGAEYDIAEVRAYDYLAPANGNYIADRTNMALHWDGYNANLKSRNLGLSNSTIDIGRWNTYAFVWTPTYIQIYIDGVLQQHITDPISQTGEFINLSSEIQNNNWSGPIPSGGYGDRNTSWLNMYVDYVRYWLCCMNRY